MHKRFVRRGNKVYGPYLYNSKRVGNKVVNEYMGLDKSGRWKKIGVITAIFVIILLGIVYAEYGIMSGTESGATSTLIIWDGTSGSMDSTNWYSNCTSFGGTNCGALKDAANTYVKFYANYSNSTVGPIIGNCSIRFNYTYGDSYTYSSFSEMAYNSDTKFYELNDSFNKRGNFTFQVNCTNSSYDTLNITDSFEIKTTNPYNLYGLTSIPEQTCEEDTTYTYNASINFTDDDDNDLPLSDFSIDVIPPTASFADCISINSNTGMITIACTNSSQAGGPYNVTVTARDGVAASGTLDLKYRITVFNDYPIISFPSGSICGGNGTCTGNTCTLIEDKACSFYIGAFDEENGTISNGAGTGIGNLTFASNDTTLANINVSNGSIVLTPTNVQVGSHRIQINVTDPNGAVNSSLFILNITNANDAPSLFFACNETNNTILTEDTAFSCMLNASDIDEGDTHTYTANYSWFTITCGAQTVADGNTSCNVTFAPTDIAVYSHRINITVTDSGILASSRIINFTVNNVPDYPIFANISNITAWANVSFWYRANATDNDTLTQFGDWVNYSDNTTLFNIDGSTGIAIFTPTAAGTFWVNITANDSTGLEVSRMINVTAYENSYPSLIISQAYNMTEGYSFYLNISANVTTDAGETLTYTDNTSLFNINSTTGEINFTPTDNEVGTHWVLINITDNHGTTNTSLFNFTVYNEEDAPVLGVIYNITNAFEGQAYTFRLNFTDADLNITGGTETINVRSNSTALFTLNANVNRSNATNGLVNFDVSFTPSASSNGTYWLNITLNDSAGLGDSQVFFINVSEANTAPFFIDTSASFCATRTAAEDTLFSSCTIIGCDNDTNAVLRFASNYSWFLFNTSNLTTVFNASWGYCANTTVNFTANQSQVGNWSILLNVTDDAYAYATYTLYFNVSNTNDAPNLAYVPALNGSYGTFFSYDFNTTAQHTVGGVVLDTDDDNDTLTFSVNATTLYTGVAITMNATTGIMTFTPVESPGSGGPYFINITVNDTSGVQNSKIVNITISTNQPPTCSVITNDIHFPTGINPETEMIVINLTESLNTGKFSATCEDPEGESPNSLNYKWYWNGTLNQTGTNNSWIYTTGYYDAGYYNVSLIVTDSQDKNSTMYNMTVNVSNVNAPPMMYGNIPNISTLISGNGWYNDVVNSRNMTTWFYDFDNDNLTYSWYRYAINESFEGNSFTGFNESWTMAGTWALFNDSANNPAIRQNETAGLKYASYGTTFTNITEFRARIKVMGLGAAGVCFSTTGDCSSNTQRFFLNSTENKTALEYVSTSTTSNNSYSLSISLNTSYWLKVILDSNLTRAYISADGISWNLTYNQSLSNAAGNISLFTLGTEAVFDDIVLKDPNLRNMTLKDEGGNNISFTPASEWHGEMPIIIAASDGINSTDSNQFTLHIDEVTVPPPQVVTQTSTSTSTVMQTKSADMAILVPSLISLTPLSKTIIPIILKNTGEIDLNTISLIATSNQTELRLNLNETKWTALKIGNSIFVNLEVDIGLLAPDRYTIRLDASSVNPKLDRFAEIVVDVREKDAVLKAQLKEMIQFTRDLFLQNPECLELSELINEAEKNFKVYQYEKGLELIHRANQGCKEFIAAKEGESKQKIGIAALSFIEEHWKTLIIESIGLIIAVLLLIYYFQRRSASHV